MKNILKKVSIFLLIGIFTLAVTSCKKDTEESEKGDTYYKIEYVVDNNVYSTYYAANGTTIAPISAPTKAGYEFDYWALNNTVYSFSEAVVNDLRLVAVYKEAQGGSTINEEVLAQLQKIVSDATYEKINTSFLTNILAGYKATKNNEVVTIYNVSKENVFTTVEAYIGINANGEIVAMNFISSDTLGKIDSFTGESLNINGTNSANWESNFTSVSGATVSSNTVKDLISSAFSQFRADNGEVSNEVYTVTFDSNGGTTVASLEVNAGKTFIRPNDPTRSLYNFIGWYLGNNAYDFTAPVTSDITLTARWISVFQFNSNTQTIVDAVELAGEIYIPERIGGVEVLELGENLFKDNKNITEVIIPETIQKINFSAFENCVNLKTVTFLATSESEELVLGINVFAGCQNLTNITLPANITSIPTSAFEGCTSLVRPIIEGAVTSIGTAAFNNCSNLTLISLKEGLTSIGQEAFANCQSLEAINLPTTLKTIGQSAFTNCTKLVSIYIPDSVTLISLTAFEGCSALNAINVSSENTSYASERGVLYNKRMTTIYYVPSKLLTTFELKNTVTSIDPYAFTNLVNLQTITVQEASVASELVGKWSGNIYNKSSNLEIYPSGLGKYNNTNISGTYNTNTGIYSFDYTLNTNTYKYEVKLDGTIVTVNATLVNGTPADDATATFTKSSVSITTFQAVNGSLYSVTTSYTATSNTSTSKLILVPAKYTGAVTILSNTTSIDTNAFKNSQGITEITIEEGNANYVEIDHIIYRRASATSTYYSMIIANRNYDGVATILKDTTGTVSSVDENCFINTTLSGIRFTSTSQIPSLYNINVFGNVPSNFKVYIPSSQSAYFVGAYNTKWSDAIKAQVSAILVEEE